MEYGRWSMEDGEEEKMPDSRYRMPDTRWPEIRGQQGVMGDGRWKMGKVYDGRWGRGEDTGFQIPDAGYRIPE